MIVRLELKLINYTPEKWVLWKNLESEMEGYCKQFGIVEMDLEYDNESHVKKFSLQYESEKELHKLMVKKANCAGKNNLEIDVVSREVLEDETLSLVQDIKNTLELATYN